MSNSISFGADENTRQQYTEVFDAIAILMGWQGRTERQHQIARQMFDGLHDLMLNYQAEFAYLVGAGNSLIEGDADSRERYAAFLAYVKGLKDAVEADKG